MDCASTVDTEATRDRAGDAPPFAWLSGNHPWHPVIEAIRAEVRARECAPADPRQSFAEAQIHAEIKGVRLADGGWRLDRSYWSEQFRAPGLAFGFHAQTLNVDADGSRRWLIWPEDPYLRDAAQWLRQLDAPHQVQVLRYVPLRRLTFRLSADDGSTIIGKLKRRSRYREAYALLETTAAAAGSNAGPVGGPRFRVAKPLRIDPQFPLYFQEALPGVDLADRMDPPQHAWLEHVGGLHAQVNALPTEGLPHISSDRWQTQALSDLNWIGWLLPERREQLSLLASALSELLEEETGPGRFCHGDLVCSQFLARDTVGDTWGITDFDLAHRGDFCRDMAIFMASLAYDVPALRRAEEAPAGGAPLEELTEAYLDGYARAAPWLRGADERLRRCRIQAELHYLGLMLKKDRYHPLAFERRMQRALRLARVQEWV